MPKPKFSFGKWILVAIKAKQQLVITQDQEHMDRFTSQKDKTAQVLVSTTVEPESEPDYETQLANYQLMATAPELYEKLDNLQHEVFLVLNDLARNHVDATPLIGAYKQAKAALTKAIDVEQHT
jgi:hypothetical protein